MGHGDVIRFGTRLEIDSKKYARIMTSHTARTATEAPPKRGLSALLKAAQRSLDQVQKRLVRTQAEIAEARKYVGKDFPNTAQLEKARTKVDELARKYTEHIQLTQADIDPREFADVDLDDFEREADNIYDDYHAPGGAANPGDRKPSSQELEAYETLGIKPGMTKDEYKDVFRKLAREHHPDMGGDAKKFREIYAAYDYLKGLGVVRETGPEYPPGRPGAFRQAPAGGRTRNPSLA